MKKIVCTFPDKEEASAYLKKLRTIITKDDVPYEATKFETTTGEWAVVVSPKGGGKAPVKLTIRLSDLAYESVLREALEQDVSVEEIIEQRLFVVYTKRLSEAN